MKALSVRQPWAALITSGKKTIELRSKRTKYRGDLLICASKFKARGHEDKPRGVAVCIVTVIDSHPMTESDAAAACCEFDPSAWSWVLANPRPVEHFPVSGSLGFFEVEMSLAKV